MLGRRVQTVYVGSTEESVEMIIYDTIPEEVLENRYVGVYRDNDGVDHFVQGPFVTTCQQKATSALVEGAERSEPEVALENAGSGREVSRTGRSLPPSPPPYCHGGVIAVGEA